MQMPVKQPVQQPAPKAYAALVRGNAPEPEARFQILHTHSDTAAKVYTEDSELTLVHYKLTTKMNMAAIGPTLIVNGMDPAKVALLRVGPRFRTFRDPTQRAHRRRIGTPEPTDTRRKQRSSRRSRSRLPVRQSI